MLVKGENTGRLRREAQGGGEEGKRGREVGGREMRFCTSENRETETRKTQERADRQKKQMEGSGQGRRSTRFRARPRR